MKILSNNAIKQISFHDALIKEMKFDLSSKVLIFTVSRAWIGFGDGQKIGACRIKISDCSTLTVRKYLSESESWIELNEKNCCAT